MKRTKRCICLLLIMAIMLTTPVFAEATAAERASNYFLHCSVYLHEMTTYTFKACFSVTALHTMDVLGASQIKIQRSSDGINWTTTKTFTKEDYTHLVDEERLTYGSEIIYTGTSGYYYRAKIILYAKDETGVAESTHYTSTIKVGG